MSPKQNFKSRSKTGRHLKSASAVPPRDSYRQTSVLIDCDVYDEAFFGESVYVDLRQRLTKEEKRLLEELNRAQRELVESTLASATQPDLLIPFRSMDKPTELLRPPFNAEYLLYLFLRGCEKEVFIGDLRERYGRVLKRFNKRRADVWYYKQVAGSLLPLLRRSLLRIGALLWLGRILRRLIS